MRGSSLGDQLRSEQLLSQRPGPDHGSYSSSVLARDSQSHQVTSPHIGARLFTSSPSLPAHLPRDVERIAAGLHGPKHRHVVCLLVRTLARLQVRNLPLRAEIAELTSGAQARRLSLLPSLARRKRSTAAAVPLRDAVRVHRGAHVLCVGVRPLRQPPRSPRSPASAVAFSGAVMALIRYRVSVRIR